MKVEFLKNLGLDDETIKAIQAESGKDVTAAKTAMQTQIDTLTGQVTDLQGQVTQRETDLTSVKDQLEKAGQSASKLSEVQKSMADLEAKYKTDTEQYQTKLADQAYEFKVRERVNGIKFSCKAAKNEFITNLMQNRLPMHDGDLLGFDEYTAKQREADPDAFKVENPEPPKNDPKPTFAPPPTNPNNDAPPTSTFNFDFLGVRKRD